MRTTTLFCLLVLGAAGWLTSCNNQPQTVEEKKGKGKDPGDDAPVIIADTTTKKGPGSHATTIADTKIPINLGHVSEPTHQVAAVAVCKGTSTADLIPVMFTDFNPPGSKMKLEAGDGTRQFTLTNYASPYQVDITMPDGSTTPSTFDLDINQVTATTDTDTTSYKRPATDASYLQVVLHYCKDRDCHSQNLKKPCSDE